MLVELALDRARDQAGEREFVIKGGVSMELRLNLRARATKDLDTVFRGRFANWLGRLDDLLSEPIADFTLTRSEPMAIRTTSSHRVEIYIDYRGRRWSTVQLEVSPAEASHIVRLEPNRRWLTDRPQRGAYDCSGRMARDADARAARPAGRRTVGGPQPSLVA